MERMDRRWEYVSREQILKLSANLKPEDYSSDWMSDKNNFEYADCVLGKKYSAVFSDGSAICFDFFSKENLKWSENGSEPKTSYYRALCAPGMSEVVFVHHMRDGVVPACCIDAVLDLETGYATVVTGTLGVPANPREVSHTIRFGEIEGINHPKESKPHAYTTELIGKAIHWNMPPHTGKPPIKHIYLSPKYYGIFMTRDDSCFMSADPADYVKIKENLYLVSVVEERRSGIQLCFLINTELLQDIVGHFGISTGNEPGQNTLDIICTVMTGRQGTFDTMQTVF